MLNRIKSKIIGTFFPGRSKGDHELDYWKSRKAVENVLANDHYSYFYTTHFGLSPEFYAGKRVLDIGCGPRGSLEWADMTLERFGLDPLADEYLKLGASDHKMKYIKGCAESMPFDDGFLDVVCSFNSLDHVVDEQATIKEIARITKPGGLFLLLTELNHEPTPTEPILLTWEITRSFTEYFDILDERHYERRAPGLYDSIDLDVPYDHTDTAQRYGILSVKFQRKA